MGSTASYEPDASGPAGSTDVIGGRRALLIGCTYSESPYSLTQVRPLLDRVARTLHHAEYSPSEVVMLIEDPANRRQCPTREHVLDELKHVLRAPPSGVAAPVEVTIVLVGHTRLSAMHTMLRQKLPARSSSPEPAPQLPDASSSTSSPLNHAQNSQYIDRVNAILCSDHDLPPWGIPSASVATRASLPPPAAPSGGPSAEGLGAPSTASHASSTSDPLHDFSVLASLPHKGVIFPSEVVALLRASSPSLRVRVVVDCLVCPLAFSTEILQPGPPIPPPTTGPVLDALVMPPTPAPQAKGGGGGGRPAPSTLFELQEVGGTFREPPQGELLLNGTAPPFFRYFLAEEPRRCGSTNDVWVCDREAKDATNGSRDMKGGMSVGGRRCAEVVAVFAWLSPPAPARPLLRRRTQLPASARGRRKENHATSPTLSTPSRPSQLPADADIAPPHPPPSPTLEFDCALSSSSSCGSVLPAVWPHEGEVSSLSRPTQRGTVAVGGAPVLTIPGAKSGSSLGVLANGQTTFSPIAVREVSLGNYFPLSIDLTTPPLPRCRGISSMSEGAVDESDGVDSAGGVVRALGEVGFGPSTSDGVHCATSTVPSLGRGLCLVTCATSRVSAGSHYNALARAIGLNSCGVAEAACSERAGTPSSSSQVGSSLAGTPHRPPSTLSLSRSNFVSPVGLRPLERRSGRQSVPPFGTSMSLREDAGSVTSLSRGTQPHRELVGAPSTVVMDRDSATVPAPKMARRAREGGSEASSTHPSVRGEVQGVRMRKVRSAASETVGGGRSSRPALEGLQFLKRLMPGVMSDSAIGSRNETESKLANPLSPTAVNAMGVLDGIETVDDDVRSEDDADTPQGVGAKIAGVAGEIVSSMIGGVTKVLRNEPQLTAQAIAHHRRLMAASEGPLPPTAFPPAVPHKHPNGHVSATPAPVPPSAAVGSSLTAVRSPLSQSVPLGVQPAITCGRTPSPTAPTPSYAPGMGPTSGSAGESLPLGGKDCDLGQDAPTALSAAVDASWEVEQRRKESAASASEACGMELHSYGGALAISIEVEGGDGGLRGSERARSPSVGGDDLSRHMTTESQALQLFDDAKSEKTAHGEEGAGLKQDDGATALDEPFPEGAGVDGSGFLSGEACIDAFAGGDGLEVQLKADDESRHVESLVRDSLEARAAPVGGSHTAPSAVERLEIGTAGGLIHPTDHAEQPKYLMSDLYASYGLAASAAEKPKGGSVNGVKQRKESCWRYRDQKRSLIKRIQPDHVKLLKEQPAVHAAILSARLPSRMCVPEFAETILLFVYHWALIDGRLPLFFLRTSRLDLFGKAPHLRPGRQIYVGVAAHKRMKEEGISVATAAAELLHCTQILSHEADLQLMEDVVAVQSKDGLGPRDDQLLPATGSVLAEVMECTRNRGGWGGDATTSAPGQEMGTVKTVGDGSAAETCPGQEQRARGTGGRVCGAMPRSDGRGSTEEPAQGVTVDCLSVAAQEAAAAALDPGGRHVLGGSLGMSSPSAGFDLGTDSLSFNMPSGPRSGLSSRMERESRLALLRPSPFQLASSDPQDATFSRMLDEDSGLPPIESPTPQAGASPSSCGGYPREGRHRRSPPGGFALTQGFGQCGTPTYNSESAAAANGKPPSFADPPHMSIKAGLQFG